VFFRDLDVDHAYLRIRTLIFKVNKEKSDSVSRKFVGTTPMIAGKQAGTRACPYIVVEIKLN
jgi:hypothetical protein